MGIGLHSLIEDNTDTEKWNENNNLISISLQMIQYAVPFLSSFIVLLSVLRTLYV